MSVLAAPRQPRAGEDAIKTKVRELTHKAPESAQVAHPPPPMNEQVLTI